MKNPYPILHNYGIFEPQLHKLYRCRLTGVLKDLPGINTASLRAIEDDLSHQQLTQRAPEDCVWAYDLLFDVLKISKDPEIICQPLGGHRSTLSRLTTFQHQEMSQLNKFLTNALTTKLQLGIIYAQYRDHLSAIDMSCHFNTPIKRIRQTRKAAIYILQEHANHAQLEHILLDSDTDLP